jgi:hypothetical protein
MDTTIQVNKEQIQYNAKVGNNTADIAMNKEVLMLFC